MQNFIHDKTTTTTTRIERPNNNYNNRKHSYARYDENKHGIITEKEMEARNKNDTIPFGEHTQKKTLHEIKMDV